MSIRALTILFSLLVAAPAHAAAISLVNGEYWEGGLTHGDITLTGDIIDGDLQRLEAILGTAANQSYNGNLVTLRLDSGGGSLSEALKISRFIRDVSIGTYVSANAVCYSVCAIVFMHGTVSLEAEKYKKRVLSPAGQLGFHAPFLSIPENTPVDVELVEEAYNVALLGVADLLETGRGIFDDGLLMQMLRRGPSDLLMVETYGQLIAWSIELEGTHDSDESGIKDAQLLMACDTLYALDKLEFPKATLEDAQAEIAQGNRIETLGVTGEGEELLRFTVNERDGVTCNLGVSRHEDGALRIRYFDRFDPENLENSDWWYLDGSYFHPPSERFQTAKPIVASIGSVVASR
jgi:hypothetical protein